MMKKLLSGLITLTLAVQLLSSCGSANDTLSHFSKKKYLKRYKPTKKIKNNVIAPYAKEKYVTKNLNPEYFLLDVIEENDYSEIVLTQNNRDIVGIINEKKSVPKEMYQPIIERLENLIVSNIENETIKKGKGCSNVVATLGILIVTFLLFLLLAFLVILENGGFD